MKIVESRICCQDVKVFIGREALAEAAKNVPEKSKVFLVRQEVLPRDPVARVFRNIVDEVALKSGEEAKDIENVVKIVERMSLAGIQRDDFVIAFGGGTLLDVVGFASSIYLRGVNLVNVPSTVLGMVDAAIGGKNAVNLRGIKNVVGTFYQPRMVVIDTGFLETLPMAEYVNGLAEVIKYAFTLDAELYDYLRRNRKSVLNREQQSLELIVYRSVVDKLSVVEKDPYDNLGVRIVLNFGHTVGHLIESLSKFSVSHGRAVAVGMVYESMVSSELGYTERRIVEELVAMLKAYGLPTSFADLGLETPSDISAIRSIVSKDKKASWRGLRLPVIKSMGMWIPITIDVDEFVEVLAKCIGLTTRRSSTD